MRLVANGMTQTQPLIIRRDPRLTETSDADLREQFKLAMQIRNETSRAHEAVIQIRTIKNPLQKRTAANDAGISSTGSLITSKLDEVERDLYQVKNRSPRDTLNYPY